MMLPARGRWSPEVRSCLVLTSAFRLLLHVEYVTYPLRTPSICKSTHHTPGMPAINHSAMYLTAWPTGNHSRKQK
jgi:hypothetical protein